MNETDKRPTAAGRWYRRRSGKLGIGLVLIAGLLLALPEILRLALIHYLPDTGIGDVAIDDVDFNLFDASAGVEALVVTREGETRLELDDARVDVSWLKLMLGQIYVERLAVDGVRFSATRGEDGQWQVVVPLGGGQAVAPEAEPAAEPEADALPKATLQQVAIRNVEVTVDSPTVAGTFGIDDLELRGISTWLQDPANLELQAHWQQALVTLNLTAQPWIDSPQVSGRLRIESAPLGGIRPLLNREPLFGDIEADLAFQLLETESGYAANAEGSLTLDELAYTYKALALQQDRFSWEGTFALGLPTNTDQPLHYNLTGDWRSQGLSIQDKSQGVQLLHWDSLQVDKLALDQALNLNIGQVALTAVEALKAGEQNSPLRTGRATLSDVSLEQGRRLTLDEGASGDAQYRLVIAEDGQLAFESVLTRVLERFAGEPTAEGTEQTPPAAEQETTGDQPPFQFAANTLRVEEGTRLTLVDRRFDTPVEQTLEVRELAVRQLNQAQPQQDTSISLNAAVGEFGSLEVEGVVRPFADNLFVDVSGELHAIELPDISPYSEAYLGYELTRGHYDHSFTVKIADEAIDLENTLQLRQLALQSVDPDKPQPVEKQMDLPLGLALDMLRDSDDNITLEVPIHGRLDDPDVSVSAVVNRALAKALKSGTTSYLKFALQPYGAMLMAADFVGEQVSAVRLEPMLFEPGSDAVLQKRDYVDKLQALLAERPQLSLTLCGRTSPADYAALYGEGDNKGDGQTDTPPEPSAEQRAALRQLAERRGTHLKRLFIERGVESRRLLLCQAEYQPEGVHGVKLGM